ncbi:hypothetical protein WA158_006066 [Blastocystis sp. Blastoise]
MEAIWIIVKAFFKSGFSLNKMVSSIAFYPPNPPHYTYIKKNGQFFGKVIIQKYERPIGEGTNVDIIELPVYEEKTVTVLHVKCKDPNGALLYFHGNACDCGSITPRCIELSKRTKLDIYIMDYEGFGFSSGKATEENIYRDSMLLYKYVSQYWNSNIYLYGESIGSTACTYLGIQKDVLIQGIILHSAVLSGASLIPGSCFFRNCDPFDNYQRASAIKSPVFQMHGTKDEIIPYKQAQILANTLQSDYPPWFVEGCTHTNIPSEKRDEYYLKVSEFIQSTLDFTSLSHASNILSTVKNNNNTIVNNNNNNNNNNNVNKIIKSQLPYTKENTVFMSRDSTVDLPSRNSISHIHVEMEVIPPSVDIHNVKTPNDAPECHSDDSITNVNTICIYNHNIDYFIQAETIEP